jgi:hypothetical protein
VRGKEEFVAFAKPQSGTFEAISYKEARKSYDSSIANDGCRKNSFRTTVTEIGTEISNGISNEISQVDAEPQLWFVQPEGSLEYSRFVNLQSMVIYQPVCDKSSAVIIEVAFFPTNVAFVVKENNKSDRRIDSEASLMSLDALMVIYVNCTAAEYPVSEDSLEFEPMTNTPLMSGSMIDHGLAAGSTVYDYYCCGEQCNCAVGIVGQATSCVPV